VTWQPIETCPLNTPVLTVYQGVVQQMVCELWSDGSWSETLDGDPLTEYTPSHWMPLPEPPPKEGNAQ
jgi:hypothetical protein